MCMVKNLAEQAQQHCHAAADQCGCGGCWLCRNAWLLSTRAAGRRRGQKRKLAAKAMHMLQADKYPLHPRLLQSALRWATSFLQANVPSRQQRRSSSGSGGSASASSVLPDAAELVGSRLGMKLAADACLKALQYSSEEWPGSFPQFVLGFVAAVEGGQAPAQQVSVLVCVP